MVFKTHTTISGVLLIVSTVLSHLSICTIYKLTKHEIQNPKSLKIHICYVNNELQMNNKKNHPRSPGLRHQLNKSPRK